MSVEFNMLVERCEADIQQAVDGKYRHAILLREDAAALLSTARELEALKEAMAIFTAPDAAIYVASAVHKLQEVASLILAEKEKEHG